MKKLLFIVLGFSFITACGSLGDKYEVNEKSDIFYKDGMTSGDAKILGNFLVQNGYFNTTTDKSVQLYVENDSISVKFIEDKGKAGDMDLESRFVIMGTAISAEVFGAKPVRIVLADHNMKQFQMIPIPGTSVEPPAK